MKISKALRLARAVFVAAALASSLIVSVFAEEDIEPSQIASPEASTSTKVYPKVEGIWTYDCEIPVQRPEQIMLTCADGGMIVTDIKWQEWESNRATGMGIYSQNMCEPSCAEGKRVNTPVRVKLSELFEYKGRNVLRALDIEAVSGRELPNGTAGFTWDVAEFAVKMNSEE